jgi:hypothetical protein
MWYGFLADVVVAIHLAYVSYVVFGELLIVLGIALRWEWIRNLWFRLTHVVMILIVAAEAVYGITCPLTTWENRFLEAAGRSANDRSFMGRLMNQAMFFECGDDSPIWLWIYVGFAALVVLTFVIAPPRWRRRKAAALA